MARFFYTLVLPILALIAIANAAPCEEKGDTVVSAVPEMDDQFYLDESVQIVVNDDIQRYLSAHNTVRAKHGARALTWNNTSAGLAQRWANGCKFQHSGGKLGPLGENLAAGFGGGYNIEKAIKSWTDEVSEYNPRNPKPSHFTQVVWKGTTSVGCAVKTCNNIFPGNNALFFVCEYFPQGNIIGRFPQNVQV